MGISTARRCADSSGLAKHSTRRRFALRALLALAALGASPPAGSRPRHISPSCWSLGASTAVTSLLSRKSVDSITCRTSCFHGAQVRARRGSTARPALDTDEQVLQPGLFLAAVKIRLRCNPDIASEPTGAAIQQGEVFEATEVVVPSGPEAMGYLKIGERGWVFDRGISGSWVGKPIVERVAEEDRKTYKQILDNPDSYAAYRSIMDSPDYLTKIKSLLDDRIAKSGVETPLSDEDKLRIKKIEGEWKDVFGGSAEPQSPSEADMVENPQRVPDAQQQVKMKQEEKMYATLAEKIMDDPEINEIMNQIKEAQAKNPGGNPGEPGMPGPKWMRLAGKNMNTVEMDESGQPKRPKVVKDLPGGPKALRWRPTATGWRMGMRVPTVCSPL